ncbi:MAG: DUF4434 domain-containing protein [Clostridia bacterium]
MNGFKYAKLSGTFLCADYCNEWDEERCDKEMKYLKELDMEYIVVMSLMLKNREGKYNTGYPTKIEEAKDFYKGNDVVELLLKSAEKFGMKIFMGLNLNDEWWDLWWDLDKLEAGKEWLFNQMEIGNQMATELYEGYYKKYPRSFYGWYWMWECWNFPIMSLTSRGRRQAAKILSDALNISLRHLSSLDSTMPCLLSPFANNELTTPEDLYHQWTDIFATTEFRYGDIFCAQDSCGAGGQKVKDLDAWYNAYRKAVDTVPGLRMWANNENFESTDWSSTTIDNYVRQLQITDKYVDVHLSFAYFHYYSPGSVFEGYHKAFKFYVENGYVSFDLPKNVTDVDVVLDEKENKATVTWKHPDLSEIAGFRIYRNNMYIGRVTQGRIMHDGKMSHEMELKFIDSDPQTNENNKLVYSVAAYNPSGNFSRRIEKKIK